MFARGSEPVHIGFHSDAELRSSL